MKTLLLLRHAKSSWDDPAMDDHSRPLNKRGVHDAPLIGKLLKKEKLVPDHILCSTAKRACQTAQMVVESCGFPGEIQAEKMLYLGGAQNYFQEICQMPQNYHRLLVVGHNPDLEDVIKLLTGEHLSLSTAALAKIDLPIDRWDELNPQKNYSLQHLWTPKELC
jgi:phosphohistidine phosphatase